MNTVETRMRQEIREDPSFIRGHAFPAFFRSFVAFVPSWFLFVYSR
jgi:hypothetical protein